MIRVEEALAFVVVDAVGNGDNGIEVVMGFYAPIMVVMFEGSEDFFEATGDGYDGFQLLCKTGFSYAELFAYLCSGEENVVFKGVAIFDFVSEYHGHGAIIGFIARTGKHEYDYCKYVF